MIIRGKPFGNNAYLEAEGALGEDAGAKGLHSPVLFKVYRVSTSSRIEIGCTSMAPLPGCCGVVVSFHTYLNALNRHTGLSEEFRKLKRTMAEELGYSLMICTADMSNIPAVGNMLKSYKVVSTFTNKRTGHLIGLGIAHIGGG